MKMYCKIIGATLFMAIALPQVNAQNHAKDSAVFPGDNFSLQGALQLFQKASCPEEFERLVNTKDRNVNNLDLNKDGRTDYVKVIDKSEKKLHALILQVPVSQTESQDIAVIELEKTGDTTAVIQIIGDKDTYGKEIMIEPGGDKRDLGYHNEWNSSTHGPANGYSDDDAYSVVVNVWYWPSVTFIYGPAYTPWVSPWRWDYYPGW